MRDVERGMKGFPVTALLLVALVACGQSSPGGGGTSGGNGAIDYAPEPSPQHDTIAYVAAGGDEIRLIDPDGSNDRRLWAHGLGDPESVYEVWSMEWNPGATRLAFASTHESWCSLFTADIFYVGADGSGYSRVTQAPACEQLQNFPRGRVQVPVTNPSFDAFSGFMYFQGAESVQPVNLAANGSGMVTFENVADFGSGEEWLQVASVIVAPNREINFSTVVDVAAGSTVTTAEATVYHPSAYWEARSPTWRPGGNELGFIYNFNGLTSLPVEPGPLEFGTALLDEGAAMPSFTDHLVWGPTPDTATTLLYYGSDPFGERAIYRVEEGDGDAGEVVLELEQEFEQVLDIAWLPDGSGFLFTLTEDIYDFTGSGHADIYSYRFGDPGVVQLTDLSAAGDFAGQLAVSADGNRVVFERAGTLDEIGYELVDPDLWLLDIAGGGLEILVNDARAPAWSW